VPAEFLGCRKPHDSLRATPQSAGLALVGVFVFLVLPFGCPWLEKMSLKRLWSGFELVAARNSVYGKLGCRANPRHPQPL